MSENILDYADLVARYETGLVDTLRSFGLQKEYLDLWVPDADLSRSLLNLFNAAAEVGQSSLAIRIPADTLATLKKAGLPILAAKHGQLSIEEGNGDAVLRITGLRVVAIAAAAPHTAVSAPRATEAVATGAIPAVPADAALRQPAALPEPYGSALKAADKDAPAPSGRPSLVTARAEIDGLVIEVAIDPKDHVIHGFTANGARSTRRATSWRF